VSTNRLLEFGADAEDAFAPAGDLDDTAADGLETTLVAMSVLFMARFGST
jgi:hypothetical protein